MDFAILSDLFIRYVVRQQILKEKSYSTSKEVEFQSLDDTFLYVEEIPIVLVVKHVFFYFLNVFYRDFRWLSFGFGENLTALHV